MWDILMAPEDLFLTMSGEDSLEFQSINNTFFRFLVCDQLN